MEWRLFPEGTVPEYTTAAWYAERDSAPHVDEALHRPRLELAARLINNLEPSVVIDLGAGDGGLLTLLDPKHRAHGYDLQPSNVEAAKRRGVSVGLVDVVKLLDLPEPMLTSGFGPVVAVATEMIEHLVDPHAFVRSIADNGARTIVASSPWTETAQDHYGYHCWAWDPEGYRALFENNGWHVMHHEKAGMFQVLLAVRT